MDAGSGHWLSDGVEPSLDHQAGLRHCLGLSAAPRLPPKKLPNFRELDGRRRLLLGHADHLAGRDHHRAAAVRLWHGNIEHDLRRHPRRERPEIGRQRCLRQSAMAVVQHRGDGERPFWWSAGREADPGRGVAQRCRDHCLRSVDRSLCGRVSDPRGEEPHRSSRNEGRSRACWRL